MKYCVLVLFVQKKEKAKNVTGVRKLNRQGYNRLYTSS